MAISRLVVLLLVIVSQIKGVLLKLEKEKQYYNLLYFIYLFTVFHFSVTLKSVSKSSYSLQQIYDFKVKLLVTKPNTWSVR